MRPAPRGGNERKFLSSNNIRSSARQIGTGDGHAARSSGGNEKKFRSLNSMRSHARQIGTGDGHAAQPGPRGRSERKFLYPTSMRSHVLQIGIGDGHAASSSGGGTKWNFFPRLECDRMSVRSGPEGRTCDHLHGGGNERKFLRLQNMRSHARQIGSGETDMRPVPPAGNERKSKFLSPNSMRCVGIP